jgi:CRISPR system Cascade subunit CasA
VKFNLIREPWIRCVDLDGQVRPPVGLAEALASSHVFAGIVDESPLVMAALHRLLLAILHRNLGPRDSETWGDLWKQRRFPSDVLEAYWTKWESHFDLFDDTHPFYQSATITERDGPGTIAKLQFHRSAGNNATLVDHTTDDLPPAMQPAEAARALVTHQTFALGGTVGYLESCEIDADKRGSDSPSARGAFCLLQGANLFETLMLNLAEYDPAAHPKDLPCWERDPSQGKGKRTPDGRVDLFTWQSRRSRLFGSQASDGSTQINRVKLVPGFYVPLMWNPFKDESLQSFVVHAEAKPDQRPWFQYRITSERAVWRNGSAIIHGVKGEKRQEFQPLTLNWIAQLVWDGELPVGFPCRLEVSGFATDQQKVEVWRREHLPVTAGLLRDPRCQESLRSSLNHANDTAYALSTATKRLAAEILSPSDFKKADPKRVMELVSSVGSEVQYWSSLSTPFYEFLESLGRSQGITDEEARDSAGNVGFEAWKRNVRNAALEAFTQASSGITQNVRGLRAQAIAETKLRSGIAKVARKLIGGGDAEEKTK